MLAGSDWSLNQQTIRTLLNARVATPLPPPVQPKPAGR
jgi:hypothetical protein